MTGRIMMLAAAAALLQLGIVAPAMAQATPAQDSEPSPAAACRKPELIDRPRVEKAEIERVTAAVQDYVDCMRPVLERSRKRAEALYAEGKKAAETSNAQATEVNALVDAYRRWAQEKASEGN